MSQPTHHIIEIPKKGIKRYIPKELAFCNAKEYSAMCGLIFKWQNGTINYEELRVQAVYNLMGLKQGNRKINELENEIFLSNVYEISKLIDSFFRPASKEGLIINQNYTNNHCPTVRPIFKKLYGPKNEFENTSFGQYEDALNLFHMYYEHPKKELLYRLFATYYLFKGEQYDQNKVEKKTKLLKLIDFNIIYGFFMFFGSFQIYLTSSTVYYEGKPIDLSILFKEPKNKSQSIIPGLGTKSLAYQLAESGVFGDLKNLRKENLWEILLRLYDITKRDLDHEAKEKVNSQ